jgi:hypothetical protein
MSTLSKSFTARSGCISTIASAVLQFVVLAASHIKYVMIYTPSVADAKIDNKVA